MKYYVAEGASGVTAKAVIMCVPLPASVHVGEAEPSRHRDSAADIFGLGIPNPRLIADAIAERTGYTVYVPDLLQGEPSLAVPARESRE